MRVFLDQIGCRLNYSEMETLATRLRSAGHNTVAAPEEADVIVFNTCAVTNDAVRGSRKQVRHLHSANPAARIAVTGCWATLERASAAALPGVALVADNQEKDLLHTLLEPWSVDFEDVEGLARIEPDGQALTFPDEQRHTRNSPFYSGNVQLDAAIQLEFERKSRTRAFIKVQDGCNNKCTFCIVTLARGDSRSRETADIVAEVQEWVEQGVQEIVLTGVHLGSYGRDLAGATANANLKTLVNAILSQSAISRLRLSSLEPWELEEGFFDLWQAWPGRLCPHLHLPLQAGTNKQLRAMARRCTVESFRQLVESARSAIPDLILTTDLIVGFPGESESDFAEGMQFVEEMRFSHAHVFPFSARPGTAAAKFADQNPRNIKKLRGRRMRELLEKSGYKERSHFVGTTRTVLWEGNGHPLTDSKDQLWYGLTDNYLRVMAVAPKNVDLHNRITKLHIETVEGELLTGCIE